MADNGERPGILTLPDLNGKIDTGEIETVLAVLPNPAGRLLGRHFPAIYFLEQIAKTGFVLPAGAFAPPAPALLCRPELDTLCSAPWLERTALVMCTPYSESQPYSAAPRVMLQHQLARAAENGFRVRITAQIQYYVFQESYQLLAGRDYTRPVPLGGSGQLADTQAAGLAEPLHATLRRQLTQAAISVAHTQREEAAGQYRLSMASMDALVAMDSLMLARQALPSLARQMGLAATFMAQPLANSPGSALRLEMSLWNPAGKQNFFAGEEETAPALSHFLAGCQSLLPEWLLFCTPTVNSFKRLRIAGVESLSAEAPAGLGQYAGNQTSYIWSTLPGADANPYLACTAHLAAGLAGIEAEQPTPDDANHLPLSLTAAAQQMAESETGRELFGKDTLQFYAALAAAESTAYAQAVTDWERSRYFLL